MNPNARISALEAKLNALTLVIEKQNETIAALTTRMEDVEKRQAQVSANLNGAPLQPEYVPQFTQWPGNGR